MPSVRIGRVDRGPFGATVVGGSVVLVGMYGHTPLWSCVSLATVALIVVGVRVAGRTPLRWTTDWLEFRFGRAARARLLTGRATLTDIRVAAGVCGIRTDGTTLVAMIQVAPDLDLPTVIAEQTVYTEDTVPVELLVPLLDQFGIAVEIDIVTTGQRVRSTGSYSLLYDQLIGSHPVVGNRLTWLVVRLDQERNLPALAQRGPSAVVAPKALATAAFRIAGRLREQGIIAHALPASAVGEASRLLHSGVELSDLTERWTCLTTSTPGRCVTSFRIDWTRLEGIDLDDCWSWNRGQTTVMVSLSGSGEHPRGLVRFVGPAVEDPLPDYLRPLSGMQSAGLMASLPTGTPIPALAGMAPSADGAPAGLLSELRIAIGPSGQILGSISGQPRHTLALPLFDPAPYNPRRRTIDIHAELPVAQQIVLRATVVGAEVEVHTARPDRWRQLVAAVGDARSLRLISDGVSTGQSGAGAATIAVFDKMPAGASTAQTTMTIAEPGAPRRAQADLAIDQVAASVVDVRIPMRTVRVDLIEPRGETRYVAAPVPPVPLAADAGRTG
ncbi:type VII secretion protein EccE [Nocardia panacis]|uniref:Type VII secretion protein EccE n=1 Tax=Nocardia panacis TaxID=2340916 RepID=A0A3A4L0B0_9NOCA|nr:type VII secretion protein EccE [Nocardia panacis]RJO79835.1 type VII secretion protein EccE [Nocardia panacis]